jgi:hypothetical protein
MSDEDLAKTHTEALAAWNKHVAARARLRLAASSLDPQNP